MNTRWGWMLIAVAAAAAVYLFWGETVHKTADFRDPDTVARGQALFAQHCAVCHGAGAQGENPDEPMGGLKPDGGYLAPALNGTGHAWHHAPDQLFRIVKEGSPAQDSPMRGWAGKMTDADIASVIAYFRSLWPEPIQSRYSEMHPDHLSEKHRN
jgi:mono/diheme cytochrome c family protein